jgi:Family of unknown function (DUF6186)
MGVGAAMTGRGLVIGAYAVLALAAVVLGLTGRAGRLGLVPVAAVVDGVRGSRVGRLLAVAVWAWLGWHLLAR